MHGKRRYGFLYLYRERCTVNVPLTFASPAFSGTKSTFVSAYDNASVSSGWLTAGSWIVP